MAHIDHLTCLILTRGPLREFDRRIIVYSKGRGKLSLVAKGTLRISSKLAGSLEPLVEAQIDVARGRSNRVIGSVLLAPWSRLHTDLQALAAGNFIAQVFDQLIDIESPDSTLYDELRSCLESIDQGPAGNNGLVVRRTIWRLIDRLGFKPRLDKCARCAAALHDKLVYSPLLGGAVCAKCAPGVEDGLEFDHAIVPELDKLLSDSSSDSPANGALDRPIAQLIEATLFSHIGARLPTDRFWRSINRLDRT